MPGLIPQSFIDELLERVPIAEVVGSRVTLKKAGNTLKACCPFHNEKTPSFNVVSKKNFYHCFGCGASGNAITFLREYDNLNFTEAVEELAKFAGMEVPRDERVQQQYSLQKHMVDALEFARHQYTKALEKTPPNADVRAYLEKRGLSAEIVERYAIGYAPDQRDYLCQKASADTKKALIRCKLVSDKYERAFELFQNRLMFPIRNPRGRVVAFGGRTLGADKAKYINSPESEVFHKSHEIYGLYEALQASRQLDKLLVVEGYMDVVSLAQFGINYAVATLGTATNADNLGVLLKRCTHLVFCFDGDNAGVQAARKAMENALPLFQDGVQLNFLLLPEGEDPDTLVRQEGQDAFERRVDNAEPLSAFFFRVYSEGLDLNLPEHRGILKQRAEPQIEKVASQVLKSALKSQLNSLTYVRSKPQFERNKDRQGGWQPQGMQASAPDIRVLRDTNALCCLGVLHAPKRAGELLALRERLQLNEITCQFLSALEEQDLQDTASLLLLLATRPDFLPESVNNLLGRLELIPEKAEVERELEQVLSKAKTAQERTHVMSSLKKYASPSEMSDAERQALKTLFSKKAN